MKYFTEKLQPHGANLSGYIHDESRELSNAAVRPAMLVLPGGAYNVCAEREAEPVALSYMAQGYQAFVLRYSVGRDVPFEHALEDGEAALHYIRGNAEELRVDKGKIGVVGFSAGGHLAAALSVIGKTKPDAAVLVYPVILEHKGSEDIKPFPGLADKVDATTPPVFIATAQDDAVVPVINSVAFISALAGADVPFEAHLFLSGGHGFSLAIPATSNGYGFLVDEDTAQWFSLSARWLKRFWGDFPYKKQERLPDDIPGRKRVIDHTDGVIEHFNRIAHQKGVYHAQR